MAADYPSTDFTISEEGQVRRVAHLRSGIAIETTRVPGNPIAVSRAYRIDTEHYVADQVFHSQEVAQAALRHLRVWLIRKYGPKGKLARK